MDSSSSSVDQRSGYCRKTKAFRSLRPQIPLPPPSQPLSVTSHAFSFLSSSSSSSSSSAAGFIDSATSESLTFSQFQSQVRSLSASLLLPPLSLSKGQLAFVLSPARLEVPVLYFSLLSIGVLVSPSNPASTPHEISHQFLLARPTVAFATSSTSHLLPAGFANVVLLDSPFFQSLLVTSVESPLVSSEVRQSDTAAVMYSSGTTGRVKAVELTHRNIIALISSVKAREDVKRDRKRRDGKRDAPQVMLLPVPLFHVFGFSVVLGMVACGVTIVLMDRFDFIGMLRALEKYRVTKIPVAPPLVLAMAKSDFIGKFDLSSLEVVGCGGAPLGKELSEKFLARFPGVQIEQGYGLTESTGAATSTDNSEENQVYGSAGRLLSDLEGKIVDPGTGEALAIGQQGELCLRGPTVMQGYLGDKEATASTLDPEGWLKTGDLCYINEDGFLFVVDRLKELIKYKAYQVPPAELEHILYSHPEISDAAVIPFPDEEAGQIPMAFVVRHPKSTLCENQVMDFVAKQVAPYKKIRRVTFIDAIPKSSAGKILRRELIHRAVSGSLSKL